MKVRVNKPKPQIKGYLTPCEALVMDALEHMGGDEVDVPAGFLGMPEGLLNQVVGNLLGIKFLLSAESVQPTPQPAFEYSQGIQVAAQVREAQEAKARADTQTVGPARTALTGRSTGPGPRETDARQRITAV